MSNPPLSIRAMQALAKNRGGECLSPEYRNNKTKLLWRCGRGHEWWARPDQVGRRVKPTWCAVCAQKKPKTREEIEALAMARKGKLLSTGRVTMQGMALWECADGHGFKMTPNNVKYGHWCPVCWQARHLDVAAKNSREGWAQKIARRQSHAR